MYPANRFPSGRPTPPCPIWSAAFAYCLTQRLYGFAQYAAMASRRPEMWEGAAVSLIGIAAALLLLAMALVLMVKKNGSRYKVSPFALNFNDDNYYLVGYDHISGSVKHYRVDKMKSIDIIDEPRQNKEMFKNFDNGIFAKKTFGMYGGEEKDLVLICDNKLAGVIIDRFGKDVYMRPIDDKVFKVAVKVNVSNQFFGWLCGIGEGIKITEPEDVVLSYKEHLKNIYSKY